MTTVSTYATSLKLSNQLKSRVTKAAERAGKTPHAFMVDAIAEQTARAEDYEAFVDSALEADREFERDGRYYAADDVFRYMRARAAGKPARKPRLRAWRK